MTQNIQNEYNDSSLIESLSFEEAIQELVEIYGLSPDDFEPEEWQNLVEYYQTLREDGGDVEEFFLNMDIETAAGPGLNPFGGQADPVELGADPIVLGSVQGISGYGGGQPAAAFGGSGYQGGPSISRDGDIDDEGQQSESSLPVVEIEGTPGNDNITGEANPERITAFGGNDTLLGAGGDDTFVMDRNLNVRDVIDGGDGYDVLNYTDNNRNARNELNNVTNVEKIVLGEATTKLTTTDGLVGDGQTLEIDGSDLGSKRLIFDGRSEIDGSFDITSDAGRDTIRVGSGDDVVHTGGNRDRVYGNDGDDSLFGGAGNDSLYGNDGNDSLVGETGNDRLYGHDGNDILDGGSGSDRLYGHDGNDVLDGGIGNDRLYGGDGEDSLTGGEDNDRLLGNDGNDTLRGGTGNDTLSGHNDNDLLIGDDGKDKLYGGSGDDSLHGGDGNDRMFGQADNDLLTGGVGNDYIKGGSGNDLLTGGAGVDSLYGESGNDTFRYEGLDEGGDKIYGFRSGQDSIELSGSDFDASAGFHSSRIRGYDGSNASLGHNDATFVFDERTGDLWYDENGDDAGGQTLVADVSGDDVTAADISIV